MHRIERGRKWAVNLTRGIIIALLVMGFSTATQAGDKVLRIAETAVELSLPGNSWGADVPMTAAVYNWLVDADAKGKLLPELAASWDSPDGKVWTVNLQKGVKFHDGSDFTADDVIWCVERTQDKELGHVDQKNFSVVEKMEKVDDHTVKFYLTEVRPAFMYMFTGYNMVMLSTDYDYAQKGTTAPMGTGPFKIKTFAPGEGAIVVRNESYWKAGLPKVDEIRYYSVSDMETRMNMLEQEKAHMVRDMAASNLVRIKADDKLTYNIPYIINRKIYMNQANKPWSDPKVVEALKYCLDAEAIAKACLGTLGKDLFISEGPVAAVQKEFKDVPLRTRDVEKAKALLAEAGYADGLDVDIFYESDIDFSSSIALILKELGAPAGFRINLKGNPRDIYLSQYWMKKVDFGITAWNARIDPSLVLLLAYRSGGPWNESGQANPELDKIIDAILTELDESKRLALYGDLQEWFHQKGSIIAVQVPFITALNKKVADYQEPMTRIMNLEAIDLKN